MRNLTLLIVFACAAFAQGPTTPPAITATNVTPSGSCSANVGRLLGPTGVIYTCQSGTWGAVSGGGGGSGTVTSASVTTANGISGTVATATTTPAITLTLGAITPSSVAASGLVSGSNISSSFVGPAGTGLVSGGALGTPSSGTATNLTGTAAGLTAGAATALAANPTNCSAGNYPLGVDASGNVESCTAAATGNALTSNPLSQFASTTSAQLAGVLSDETGTGLAVFGTAPTIDRPSLTGYSTLAGNVPATGFQNTTDNPLSSGATAITVSSTTGYPSFGLLLLATSATTTTNEIVSYTSVSATQFLGVTRGLYGTTGSSHAVSSFAIPIESITSASSTTLPDVIVAHWNSTQVIIYGSPLFALGTPSGTLFNHTVTSANTLTVSGGLGVLANFYQDLTSAKGYWATNASGINWQNVNRVTGNVNVSLDAVTSQSANVLQMRNATPVITTAFSPSTGIVNTYNTVATAGMGVAPIYTYSTATGQTASIGATNLQCGGAVCPAGVYRVHVYDVVTTTGTGTLTTTVGWTDPGQAQSITSAGVATTAKNFEQLDYVVRADGIANITYATTLSVSGTYSIYVTLERLQ